MPPATASLFCGPKARPFTHAQGIAARCAATTGRVATKWNAA